MTYKDGSRAVYRISRTLGVDFLIVKVERFAVRRSFSHEFEAKKFDVGEGRNWIEWSLWSSLSGKGTRNRPLGSSALGFGFYPSIPPPRIIRPSVFLFWTIRFLFISFSFLLLQPDLVLVLITVYPPARTRVATLQLSSCFCLRSPIFLFRPNYCDYSVAMLV